MRNRIKQSDASKVNSYIVTDFHDCSVVHYECSREFWGREVHKMYLDLASSNINCPMVPFEVMKWNDENPEPRIAYFAILDD